MFARTRARGCTPRHIRRKRTPRGRGLSSTAARASRPAARHAFRWECGGPWKLGWQTALAVPGERSQAATLSVLGFRPRVSGADRHIVEPLDSRPKSPKALV